MHARYIPAIALMLAIPASGGDKNPKPPKVQPPPKAHPAPGPGGGPPAPNRTIDQQIEKLSNMSPAQREKALSQLPPERRQRIETRLERLKNMTPEQKARLEKFQSLPPEQQQRIRQLSQKIQALPEDRKPIVRKELAKLRNMPEDEREKRINSPEFQKNFSPQEQEILKESPSILPQNYF